MWRVTWFHTHKSTVLPWPLHHLRAASFGYGGWKEAQVTQMEPINMLELRDLLHTLLWLCKKLDFEGSRWLHLLTSQVAFSVATKEGLTEKLFTLLLCLLN